MKAASDRSWGDIGEAIAAQEEAAAAAAAEDEEEEEEEGVAVRVVRRVQVGLQLHHPFALASGCGFPPWTNYVAGFAGCLDYVWCEPRVDSRAFSLSLSAICTRRVLCSKASLMSLGAA